jgi:hypothetical protein
MPRDWPWTWPRISDLPQSEFPKLTYGNQANHRRTSWSAKRYNCIAWAAGYIARPWWPLNPSIAYWPPTAIDAVTLDAFISAFQSIGYEVCKDPSFERSFEKVAIYVDSHGVPTHAARQLRNAKWTSKLGDFPDIEHNTLNDVNCDTYGMPKSYLRRPRRTHILSQTIQRTRTIGYWLMYWIKDLRAVGS